MNQTRVRSPMSGLDSLLLVPRRSLDPVVASSGVLRRRIFVFIFIFIERLVIVIVFLAAASVAIVVIFHAGVAEVGTTSTLHI
jgi:hypothetical protein